MKLNYKTELNILFVMCYKTTYLNGNIILLF